MCDVSRRKILLGTAASVTMGSAAAAAPQNATASVNRVDPVAAGVYFHQGDIDDYRFQLTHRSSRWFESVNPELLPDDSSECPNDEPAPARFVLFWPDLAGSSLSAVSVTNPPAFQHLLASTRGPPAIL